MSFIDRTRAEIERSPILVFVSEALRIAARKATILGPFCQDREIESIAALRGDVVCFEAPSSVGPFRESWQHSQMRASPIAQIIDRKS